MSLGKSFTPVTLSPSSVMGHVTPSTANNFIFSSLWSEPESHLSQYSVVCEISWCRCQQLTALSISTALVTKQSVVDRFFLSQSLSSNIAITIRDTDCTILQRDGQAELASVKHDVSQNRLWLICGKRIVVDSTRFESVTARLTSMNTEIRSPVQCQVFDSTNHHKHYCWVCHMETELQKRTSLSCQFEQ